MTSPRRKPSVWFAAALLWPGPVVVSGLAWGFSAALIGVAFKTALYKVEDLCDAVWEGRPEWARPAVGGIA